MKLLKICFIVLFFGIGFTACERQGKVRTEMDGTPSNADSVLPRKFKNQPVNDSVKEAREKNLAPEYRR
ncbi:MAG TPA: hypothetical protein VFI29_16145 [Hanamia sp.]|nr:hypothetical protein [Hanamia sp.]